MFTLPANRVLLFTFLSLLNIIRIVINFCIRAPPLQPLSKYASQKLQVTSHRNSFKDSPKEFSFFLHTLVLLYYPIYMYVYGVGHNMCVIGREKARSTMAKVKCILSRVYIYILGPHRMWYPFPYQSTNKSIWYTAVQGALIHGLCPPPCTPDNRDPRREKPIEGKSLLACSSMKCTVWAAAMASKKGLMNVRVLQTTLPTFTHGFSLLTHCIVHYTEECVCV